MGLGTDIGMMIWAGVASTSAVTYMLTGMLSAGMSATPVFNVMEPLVFPMGSGCLAVMINSYVLPGSTSFTSALNTGLDETGAENLLGLTSLFLMETLRIS